MNDNLIVEVTALSGGMTVDETIAVVRHLVERLPEFQAHCQRIGLRAPIGKLDDVFFAAAMASWLTERRP